MGSSGRETNGKTPHCLHLPTRSGQFQGSTGRLQAQDLLSTRQGILRGEDAGKQMHLGIMRVLYTVGMLL